MDDCPRYEKVNGRVLDHGKYVIVDKETGRVYRVKYVGIHHNGENSFAGGFTSSFREKFETDDRVNVESGFSDIRMATIGDITEAYEILKTVINERKPQTFMEKCECVMETVTRYFGDFSNVDQRVSYLPAMDEHKKEGTVADFAHKNAAACVERAMLSQNLLKLLGIDSTFKSAAFINNLGKNAGIVQGHAFNVIANDGKYYIFDSTQPTLRNGIISPIVAEIPKEVYESIIEQRARTGISVRVTHYNPFFNTDFDVIYDACWDKTYDARGSLENSYRKG